MVKKFRKRTSSKTVACMGEVGNKRLLEQEKGVYSSVPGKKFLKTHHNSWLHKDTPKGPSGTRTPAAPGMAGSHFPAPQGV